MMQLNTLNISLDFMELVANRLKFFNQVLHTCQTHNITLQPMILLPYSMHFSVLFLEKMQVWLHHAMLKLPQDNYFSQCIINYESIDFPIRTSLETLVHELLQPYFNII